MDKQIKLVDKTNKIIQITTVDERWYCKEIPDPKSGIPSFEFVPSVTWIASYYPKGVEYHKWIATKGWDKAEEIKHAAGDKGSKVHSALEGIFDGKSIKMTDLLPNPTTGNLEPITLEEWECIMAAVDWANARQPESVKGEFVIYNDKDKYAGTVDRIFMLDGEPWIVDFKTSQSIWTEHRMQISAYKHALMQSGMPGAGTLKMMALQIGYKKNRLRWKENTVEDKYDLFLAAKKIWQNENPDAKPKQRDYPMELSYERIKVETTKTENQ